MKLGNVIYFPFAPEIPWKLKNNKYIIPELDADSWKKLTSDRDIIISGNGGLIETYLSLSILEYFNFTAPYKKLYHTTNKYKELFDLHGLSKKIEFNLDVDSYPTPIFMDKNNFTIFNYLNNYIDIYTYKKEFGYSDTKPIIKQEIRNFVFTWDKSYYPKFRSMYNTEVEGWSKISKFYMNNSYAIIIPEKTEFTIHKNNCLNWNTTQVKAMVSILEQNNIQPVILTDNPAKYYGIRAFFPPFKLGTFMFLIENAKLLLSNDIDFILLALILSDVVNIFSIEQKNEMNIIKNAKFLEKNNKINIFKSFTPLDVIKNIGE